MSSRRRTTGHSPTNDDERPLLDTSSNSSSFQFNQNNKQSWGYSIFFIVSLFLAFFLVNNSLETSDLPPTHSVYNPSTGFNAVRAQRHLNTIASAPHGVNSPNIDKVMEYLLDQVHLLQSKSDKISYIHDNKTQLIIPQHQNGFNNWLGSFATYFPASNLVVRFNGTESSGRAVLVSAHFDSRPLSPGATDAGVAVSVGLEILEALIQSPPVGYDVLVNFNNGEEMFLLGARAYIHHPWYNDTDLFINLEGSGAGGKALLFQSSNTALTKALFDGQSHHSNIIGNDLFSMRIIPSATDYQVYTKDLNLPGVDIAMYRNRAFYHTVQDDLAHAPIATTHHMGTVTFQGIQNLAKYGLSKTFNKSVYFDWLDWFTVVFDLHTCYKFILGFYVTEILILSAYFYRYQNYRSILGRENFRYSIAKGTSFAFLGYILAAIIGFILTKQFIRLNPMVIHSWPRSVFVLFLVLSVWCQLLAQMIWIKFDKSDYTVSALQTSSWLGTLLMYNILLFIQYITHKSGLASLFFLSFQAWTFLAGFLVYLKFNSNIDLASNPPSPRLHATADPTTTWQKIQPGISLALSFFSGAIVIFGIGLPLLLAGHQGPPTGASPYLPYLTCLFFTSAACLPLGPNLIASSKIKQLFTLFSIGIALIFTILLFQFPYTETSPLPINFQHFIELNAETLNIESSTVRLDISSQSDLIIPLLPMIPKKIMRNVIKVKSTFDIVDYDTPFPKLPSYREHQPVLHHYQKVDDDLYEVDFTFMTPESRVCRLEFPNPTYDLRVAQFDDEFVSIIEDEKANSTDHIRLFRSTIDRSWRLKFTYRQGATDQVAFRVESRCYIERSNALQPLLAALPSWATLQNRDLGVMEVHHSFQLEPKISTNN